MSNGADPLTGDQVALLVAQAFSIANAAVVTDIESQGIKVEDRPGRWYDVRPMLDPREHSAQLVDMFTAAIAFGLATDLLTADPIHAHLVRINREL